jgi:hypothetical protein
MEIIARARRLPGLASLYPRGGGGAKRWDKGVLRRVTWMTLWLGWLSPLCGETFAGACEPDQMDFGPMSLIPHLNVADSAPGRLSDAEVFAHPALQCLAES